MIETSIYKIDQQLANLYKLKAYAFTLQTRTSIEDRIAELENVRAQLTDDVPFQPMTDEAWEAESIMMAKLYGN